MTAGLRYELNPTLGICYYEPAGPFVVDGIRYDFHARGDNHPRLMVELLLDHVCVNFSEVECRGESPVVTLSRPPTEDELDRYVRSGKFPPQVWVGWRPHDD